MLPPSPVEVSVHQRGELAFCLSSVPYMVFVIGYRCSLILDGIRETLSAQRVNALILIF